MTDEKKSLSKEKRLKRKQATSKNESKNNVPLKKKKIGPSDNSKRSKPQFKVPASKEKFSLNKRGKGYGANKSFKNQKPGFQGKYAKGGFKGKQQFAPQKLPKETAKSRKLRKMKRQQIEKPNYELSCKAKKIWETLRIQNGTMEKCEKFQMVENLMNVVSDYNKKINDLFFAHDTSRVIQTCLKLGSRQQRTRIFNALKGNIEVMCKNRYSRNIVWKMLKYGLPDERNFIIKSFAKDGYRLAKQNTSSEVIEYAYNNHANASERDFLVKLLYGRVFRNLEKAATKDSKETKSFSEMMAAHPDKKESMLVSFKTALEPFAQKAALKNTIVHRAFRDFFQSCDDAGQRTEMIDILRESVIHIMHTRDGAHVAMECLWHGTKKDRKIIIKTMKEFVLKLSCEEFGHLVLLAAFDCVDDTVLMKKALIQPLLQKIDELIVDKFGRKVLLYLLTYRDTSHFRPSIVEALKEGDENESSKKSMDLRRRELTEAVSPAMIEYVVNNIQSIVYNHARFVFVDAVFLHCVGSNLPIAQALLNLMNKPYKPDEKDEDGHMHIVEDPCGHLIIKRIIKGEADFTEENKEATFSHLILDEISLETLISWTACNRGTQILLALVESKKSGVSTKALSILKKKKKHLKKTASFKSAQILMEKLP